MACMRKSRAAVLLPSAGAKPPSSPSPVPSFFSFRVSLRAWKTSTAMRSALPNESVPVPQLDRLALAGGGAGAHGRAAPGARLELDLDLDGGIAARVEDLASVDAGDRGHVLRTSVRTRSRRARGSARPAGRAAPANASSRR